MRSLFFSMKVFLVSAGVLSLAMAMKFSIPIALNGAPALWSIITSSMKPPYLYIIINGIIITIAASSRFHHSKAEPPAVRSDRLNPVKTPPAATFESILAPEVVNTAVPEPVTEVEDDKVVDLKPVMVNGSKVDFAAEVDKLIRAEAEDMFDESRFPYNSPLDEAISQESQMESLFPAREKPLEDEDVFDESRIPYDPTLQETTSPESQMESLFPVREKPLVSSRFVHRKPNRITPEVGGLRRVARPKKQETLESTWKMITEGRHVPLTRHMKKSDTWEHHAPPAVAHVVPKSETFKERSSYEPPPPPSRIRKEPSLGQDELNRRVEAFIHKFNEEMKMQRQESLNQFMEMINRGV